MARPAIEGAFRALHRGEATLASVISLPFRNPEGLAHIKAGHLHDDGVWTVKVSSDFDPGDGGPTRHGGLMLVVSATDGSLVGVLGDRLLHPNCGPALRERLRPTYWLVACDLPQHRYAGVEVRYPVSERAITAGQAVDSVQGAVRGAGIVITTTPSTVPLVEADWLDAGTHVTAVGSDEPSKHELAPDVLARASVVAVDDRRQAASFGELHHAILAGLRTEDDTVTLGELLEGVTQGRVSDEDITVADLTGVGVQDAAIAALVLRERTRLQ
jgi:ornithine cyclodeaminase